MGSRTLTMLTQKLQNYRFRGWRRTAILRDFRSRYFPWVRGCMARPCMQDGSSTHIVTKNRQLPASDTRFRHCVPRGNSFYWRFARVPEIVVMDEAG